MQQYTWFTQYFGKSDVRPKKYGGKAKTAVYRPILWWIVNPINQGRRRIMIVGTRLNRYLYTFGEFGLCKQYI